MVLPKRARRRGGKRPVRRTVWPETGRAAVQIAFTTYSTPEWSLETVAERAARLGYDAVEIRAGQKHGFDADATPQRCAQVRKLFAEDRVAICALGSSCRFAPCGPEEHAAQVATAQRLLEVAAAVGAPVLRVFGGAFGAPTTEAEAVARVVDALEQLAGPARAAGVKVALETHDGFSAAARVRQVLAQIDDPFVGACWDWLHPYRMGESVAETARHLHGRVVHVHAKDALRDANGHWQAEYLGRGVLPLGDLYRAARDEGYDGALSFEWERGGDPEPIVALQSYAQGMRTLGRALPG